MNKMTSVLTIICLKNSELYWSETQPKLHSFSKLNTSKLSLVYIHCLEQYLNNIWIKERCHAKYLEGHLNELGLLIGPNKSGSSIDEAA